MGFKNIHFDDPNELGLFRGFLSSLKRIVYKKDDPKAITPIRSTEESAGIDLYVIEDIVLESGQRGLFDTGLIFEIPKGTVLELKGRSKMEKMGLCVRAGIVDSDYRGRVKILFVNESNKKINIEYDHKKAVAQGLIRPVFLPELIAKEEIDLDTERGNKGIDGDEHIYGE